MLKETEMLKTESNKAGAILDSKGMRAIFKKKGKKGQKKYLKWAKKGETFENFVKNVQHLKIFWKGRWLRAIIARYKVLEKACKISINWK